MSKLSANLVFLVALLIGFFITTKVMIFEESKFSQLCHFLSLLRSSFQNKNLIKS